MSAPVVDLLALLVRIPSPSGGDGEVRCLEEAARCFAGEPAARAELHRDAAGRTTCLTVTPAVPDDRPVLLFSAHIDVVPVTDPAAWTHDPFGAVIADGRLHGRGSSDMKSGLAAALVVVRTLLAEGAPVALAVSRSEEVGCRGAADVAAALDGIRVGAVVVPESTSNEVVLGHRGALWLSVLTAGRAAHGSTPERGDNAVLAMARVLTGSDGPPLGAHPELGRETWSVGTIAGGTVPNIVPDSCRIEVDHRLAVTPAEDVTAWWRLRPGVAEVVEDLRLDPVWTPAYHPFVRSLPSPVASAPASYYTDASVLQRTLPPGTPVVVWGPGDPRRVHAVDESVALADVVDAVDLYERAARAWWAGPGAS